MGEYAIQFTKTADEVGMENISLARLFLFSLPTALARSKFLLDRER